MQVNPDDKIAGGAVGIARVGRRGDRGAAAIGRGAKCALAAVGRFQVFAGVLVALVVGVVLTWTHADLVWSRGAFFDTDDALRAVQVRDLLNGQPWFDMTATRLDPPGGSFMHWSRVVDAPLALCEALLGVWLAPEAAERATRLVFPLAMLGVLYALAARNARILGGATARLPAIFLTLLSSAMFGQFLPGRIDHHAPQIVLLMATIGFFLNGLDPVRARVMGLAGATMGLSIAISLENLPFFVVLFAFLMALFVCDGHGVRALLRWFGVGVLVGFPLCFVATVAPSRYFLSTCDAYSAVHLGAAISAALGFIALATASERLRGWVERAFVAALTGGGALASVAIVAPHCMGDPLVGLDPLLRDLWLAHVSEIQSIFALMKTDLVAAIAMAAPVALGLIVAASGSWRSSGLQRQRWLVLAGVIAVGFFVGLWKIRVFTSVTPLAMTSLAVAVVVVARRITASSVMVELRPSLTIMLCFAISDIGLTMALTEAGSLFHWKSSQTMSINDHACLSARTLSRIAELPRGRIAAPIDIGSHLMAFTPHSVFAAPYHRDNHGNRVVIDAFLAPSAEAEVILRAAGADLIVLSAHDKLVDELVQRAPLGLAATLAQGEAPAWLEEVANDGSRCRIFTLRSRG